MPSLSDALSADVSNYSPVDPGSARTASAPSGDLQPNYNTVMRCPLPPIFQAAPDSLRQFYIGSQVPQTRLLSAVTSGVNGGGSTGGNVAESIGFSSTTTTITSGSTAGTMQQAVLVSPILNPGNRFTGFINIAKGFQMLGLSVSNAARVQLYGTLAAQNGDLYRGIDVPPPAGTSQNIITDLVFDTLPYQWAFQNRTGSNGDSPQKPLAYITITNVSSASTAVTVVVQYVPLES